MYLSLWVHPFLFGAFGTMIFGVICKGAIFWAPQLGLFLSGGTRFLDCFKEPRGTPLISRARVLKLGIGLGLVSHSPNIPTGTPKHLLDQEGP